VSSVARVDAHGELVEVLDAAGDVVDVVDRAAVRAGNLRHRSVMVVVLTGADEVVVHRRSPDKDLWPSRWDLAFGGVVGAGEPDGLAARRELAEEAGIDAPLELGGSGTYRDDEVDEVAALFVARHDGPFTPVDGEVVAIDRVPLGELDRWCVDRPCCADTVALVLPLLAAWRSVPSESAMPDSDQREGRSP
jgi:8-oxo-dGTP pyrophosphatase MutT (NUDIX family)